MLENTLRDFLLFDQPLFLATVGTDFVLEGKGHPDSLRQVLRSNENKMSFLSNCRRGPSAPSGARRAGARNRGLVRELWLAVKTCPAPAAPAAVVLATTLLTSRGREETLATC